MTLKIRKARSIMGYGYSKFVTLPLVWLQHHNLEKKDRVVMEIDDNFQLIIMPSEVKSETKKVE